jgi:hypothetical protein
MQAAVRPLGMFGTDHSLSFFLEESLGRMKNAAMPTALRKKTVSSSSFGPTITLPRTSMCLRLVVRRSSTSNPLVELVYTRGMKVADISQAHRLVKQHHALLLQAFQDHENRK